MSQNINTTKPKMIAQIGAQAIFRNKSLSICFFRNFWPTLKAFIIPNTNAIISIGNIKSIIVSNNPKGNTIFCNRKGIIRKNKIKPITEIVNIFILELTYFIFFIPIAVRKVVSHLFD